MSYWQKRQTLAVFLIVSAHCGHAMVSAAASAARGTSAACRRSIGRFVSFGSAILGAGVYASTRGITRTAISPNTPNTRPRKNQTPPLRPRLDAAIAVTTENPIQSNSHPTLHLNTPEQ